MLNLHPRPRSYTLPERRGQDTTAFENPDDQLCDICRWRVLLKGRPTCCLHRVPKKANRFRYPSTIPCSGNVTRLKFIKDSYCFKQECDGEGVASRETC
ncbi:MAG TPA: hypothetical protein VFA15_08800, partial [Nitrososphaera sp.]|nr:hypothetical protein [Nitrososphaera sp.]